jgi:altronate dehydratase large subunit
MNAPRRESQTMTGYRRPDGRAGVRNHVLVLGINGLALRVAERICRNLPGTICVASPSGRGLLEPDLGAHFRQLAGIACNPNVGAVLVVGVDDETLEQVLGPIRASGKPFEALSFAQLHEDTLSVLDRGVRSGARLARAASAARRVPIAVADLVVGVECGHSDGTSGMTCNPVVGDTADWLVDQGAAVIMGETVEWLGAEHLLARRGSTPEVANAILAAVNAREAFAMTSGRSLTGNNPGEENIRGGISTIEEKALGAIAKSGSRPITGVLQLAQAPPGPGLYLMDAPSFSPESLTGFAAAGAQLMLFTTGPGNSFANGVAPTIKLSAQAETIRRLPEQIDFDASGPLTEGDSIAGTSARLRKTIAEICCGTLTWGEILGEGLDVPARLRGSL